jgi:hypothetical protein
LGTYYGGEGGVEGDEVGVAFWESCSAEGFRYCEVVDSEWLGGVRRRRGKCCGWDREGVWHGDCTENDINKAVI